MRRTLVFFCVQNAAVIIVLGEKIQRRLRGSKKKRGINTPFTGFLMKKIKWQIFDDHANVSTTFYNWESAWNYLLFSITTKDTRISKSHYEVFTEDALLTRHASVVWIHQPTSACTAHLPACEDVPSQLDLGKVALSDGFEQSVVTDVGLLRLLGASGPNAGPGRACADLLTAISVCCVLQKERRFSGRFSLSVIVHGHLYTVVIKACRCARMFTQYILIKNGVPEGSEKPHPVSPFNESHSHTRNWRIKWMHVTSVTLFRASYLPH